MLAHGVGDRQDLPISVFYAYAGAFAALFVSFLALGLLWPESRFSGSAGRPVAAGVQRVIDGRVLRYTLRGVGLVGTFFVVGHLLVGPDDPDRNPAPGAIYVVLWVGLVPASVLFGPVWRLLNPLRTLHLLACRVLRRDADGGRPLPARLGFWPAAVGLAVFTWLELVSPEPASRGTLLSFVVGYSAVHLLAAARYGSAWFGRGDAFEVYSALLGHLSPLGRRGGDGRLVLRHPFHSLDAVPQLPGLAATACVLLGSTAYDGYSATPSWIDTLQTSALGRTATGTLGLLAAILGAGALFALCTAVSRLISGGGRNRAGVSSQQAFAHSLLPIATGYLVAHYFSLFATEAPRTVTLAYGTDNPVPGDPPLSPSGLATLQVAAVVTGHVLGVVAAHDRAVRLFPPHRAVAGQLPLLVLMICYTVGGLALLLA
ncbi:hypothetical protein [Streptomyces boninensis]|uniref:hypothetical protein n=1 Tax=Streptomyces boninensis TaxID=2039455 RepID=UPI003B227C07